MARLIQEVIARATNPVRLKAALKEKHPGLTEDELDEMVKLTALRIREEANLKGVMVLKNEGPNRAERRKIAGLYRSAARKERKKQKRQNARQHHG